jgi:hypothetical protein
MWTKGQVAAMSSSDYGQYGHDLALLVLGVAHGSWSQVQDDVSAALDGQASDMLRTLVPREIRRRQGAFFTSGPLRTKFAAMLSAFDMPDVDPDRSYWDPACGAGDLLLAASDQLPLSGTLAETLRCWGDRLRGHDTQTSFVEVARLRLIIAAVARHRSHGDDVTVSAEMAARSFPGLQVGDGLDALYNERAFKGHLILNPPFGSVAADTGCDWSTGMTSQAAIFLLAAATVLAKNGQITAILPDVLRSGSRYAAWRSRVNALLSVAEIATHGQFDDYADVDVFLLQGSSIQGAESIHSSRWWTELVAENRIGDYFEVRVGPVVDNRDPCEGPEAPFLTARGMPPAGEIDLPERTRRFSGNLISPPFVAIRRTSRPGPVKSGISRASGVIVLGSKPVAVDNHLITLKPRRGGLAKCRDLIEVLDSNEVRQWLDQRIRCRHMTVGVIRSLPWRQDASSGIR